jgi:tetrachloro-p-hydroquinone reductive dehalogenase
MVPQITAYTADISVCSQICRLAIHEHGLSCVHVDIDIEGEMVNYEPWFVRIQPKMTVPAMKYDDTVLGDSKDILYFLARKHPEQQLYPAHRQAAIDNYIRAFYDNFGTIAAFTFAHWVRKSPQVKAFIARGKNEKSIAKLKKLGEDPEFKQLAQQKLTKKLRWDMVRWAESQDVDALDVRMGVMLRQMETDLADDRSFLLGEQYTLADVVGTAYCARIHFNKGEELFGPNVTAYWHRMKERPSFKDAYVCAEWEDSLMSKQVADFAADAARSAQ